MSPRAALAACKISPKSSIYTLCKPCLARTFSASRTLADAENDELRPATNLDKRPPGPSAQRQAMFNWLEGPGSAFRYPLPGSTNYLSAYNHAGQLIRAAQSGNVSVKQEDSEGTADTDDARALEAAATTTSIPPERREDLRPFPNNKAFYSESILSEDLRLEIWRRVQVEGQSIRQTSAELQVEMRRVAAVVRLVEIERRMKAEGKPLAIPYARAIHSMVPTTNLDPISRRPDSAHESINDLEQHPLTFPQLFYPTSESRAFNRTDAGRVFSGAPRLPDHDDYVPVEPWQDDNPELIGKRGHEKYVLKPADSRIPHPHLIAAEKDRFMGESPAQQVRKYNQRLQEDAEKRKRLQAKREAAEEGTKTRIEAGRWQFVVTDVQTSRQGTGINGRGTGSPGHRYGVPSEERKRGRVKIPTKVDV
ncbi:hypothetical protein B0A52_06897 [Exophiala mesophila]|uniref:Ribosomal protein S35, mitochondrial n=1 Tax=Exophiala mesophila TaxID=212818 RepID=A0A438N161_EXOME|nr:hypothetical protein B0A52_06897 [Exophiala mesophila]